MTTTKPTTRKFLGKVKDFRSKEERKLEKLKLKAYLNGQDRCLIGYSDGKVLITRNAYTNLDEKAKESYNPIVVQVAEIENSKVTNDKPEKYKGKTRREMKHAQRKAYLKNRERKRRGAGAFGDFIEE